MPTPADVNAPFRMLARCGAVEDVLAHRREAGAPDEAAEVLVDERLRRRHLVGPVLREAAEGAVAAEPGQACCGTVGVHRPDDSAAATATGWGWGWGRGRGDRLGRG